MAKVGRPTKYKPEMCDMVLPVMQDGGSIEQVALKLDISKPTLYEWIRDYPEFSNAINKGRLASECWWQSKGHKNLENKDFNAYLYKINMQNRFDWRENKKVSGDRDNPIEVNAKVEHSLDSTATKDLIRAYLGKQDNGGGEG